MASSHESGRDLLLSESFRLPVLEQALALLDIGPGSRGLDVGCGIGTITLPAARLAGPTGRVVGLDLDGELLQTARQRAAEAGLRERISFRQGDMIAPPFALDTFDWLISVDCAGYAPTASPRALIRGLAGLLKPGGTLALLAWSSQMLLPGYPALEARLNATPAGIAPFQLTSPPEDHFLRVLGWFERTGLTDRRTFTLAGQVQAPLGAGEKEALAALLAMRWPGAEKVLEPGEAALFKELTDPESPGYILDREDYLAFFTYTMFRGARITD